MTSLQHQPLLLVIRPEPDDLAASGSGLLDQVKQLHAAGLRHLEVAWLDQPGWMGVAVFISNSTVLPKGRQHMT